jgi:hypothetical protein
MLPRAGEPGAVALFGGLAATLGVGLAGLGLALRRR